MRLHFYFRPDFAGFFLLPDYFADPAKGKLLALGPENDRPARRPQLQHNGPTILQISSVLMIRHTAFSLILTD